MRAPEPHRLASWILTRCTCDSQREALLGDLAEQYRERGAWWYWRQTLGAVRVHAVRLALADADGHAPVVEFIGDLMLWIALGMCALIELPIYADLIISWTPLARSERSIVAVSAIIGVLLIVAATVVHRLRNSRASYRATWHPGRAQDGPRAV